MAQGLAFTAGLPAVPVSTLAALAQGAADDGHPRVLAALDARMGEVYWGAYAAGTEGLVAAAGEECVRAPAAVPRPDGEAWFGAGSGWATHGEALRARLGDAVGPCDGARLPRAGAVARLAAAAFARGEAVPADRALPVYLRNEVAARPG